MRDEYDPETLLGHLPAKHLTPWLATRFKGEPTALRRLSEDELPQLGSASLQTITWSIVSGFKGLENDVVILAALTDIETDWHRGVAYVGMSRARTRLHVIIHDDCDGKRREREVEWEARGEGDVGMVL